MSNINSSDPSGVLRQLSHEQNYTFWQAAKNGETLEGEEAQIVQAMREHPEYYDTWEHATEFAQEQVVINGVEPFLHIAMHTIVENQGANNTPPEVRAVLKFKATRRIPRHQAVHEIANVFTESLWSVLHDLKPFDNEAYRRKLSQMLPRYARNKQSH